MSILFILYGLGTLLGVSNVYGRYYIYKQQDEDDPGDSYREL